MNRNKVLHLKTLFREGERGGGEMAVSKEDRVLLIGQSKEDCALLIEDQSKDRSLATGIWGNHCPQNASNDGNATRHNNDTRGPWNPAGQKETPFGLSGPDRTARFVVGQDRELLLGSRNNLAAVSPIFQAMFRTPWTEDKDIEIPDVSPEAFRLILRYADKRRVDKLKVNTVWEALKAADKYQLVPVVHKCFHYLRHHHPGRHGADHLCVLLETAHHLNYRDEHDQCLAQVLQHGGKVLGNASAVAQLCYHCLLDVVRADHLQGVQDEVLVYKAVLGWTESRCGRGSSREDLRRVAGDLVYHVRYLTLPGPTLSRLLENPSSSGGQGPSAATASSLETPPSPCLLTEEEVEDLVRREGSLFPATVHEPRRQDHGGRGEGRRGGACWGRNTLWVLLVFLILLITFLAQYAVTFYLVAPLVGNNRAAHGLSDSSNETLSS
ncbi:uncharacterized protein LOC143292405 [Babylonia areolata]|uniref:uncharacterized protein LOC143292405 n=1 Tax=Babylonia areolata TaxID=304850 RepID=UPI003FD40030